MSALKELEGLVFGKIEELKAFYALFKLETRLAAQSIVPLLCNVFLIVMIVISLWFSIMTVIGYCAFLVFDSLLFALLSVLALNVLILFGLFKYLKYNLHNISFEKTRNYWKETDYELEKTITCQNSDSGQQPASTTMPGDKT